MRILLRSFIDFFRHDGPVLAGSITCFFMMTFVPFFLLLVSVFGYLLGENREFYDFLLRKLIGFFPEATRGISDEIGKLITYRGIGLLTMGVYLYFSYQLYYSIERSVNIILGLKEKRSQLVSIMFSLFVMILTVVFIIVSFGAASFIPILDSLSRYVPVPEIGKMTRIIISYIVPVLLSFLVSSALYLLLPTKRIKLRHAMAGALFYALFVEAAKHIFTLYAIAKVSQLGNIYGPLTAIVIFLLWVFYAACLFLVGAELVRNLGVAKQESPARES
jgi:membrane protein